MKELRNMRNTPDITIGYAVGHDGAGVAYARLSNGNGEPLRVGFTVRPLAGCDDRESAYGAAEAVAVALRKRGHRAATLRIDDPRLVADLAGAGTVPPALAMRSIALRCALNALGNAKVVAAQATQVADLEARARAEVTLRIAA